THLLAKALFFAGSFQQFERPEFSCAQVVKILRAGARAAFFFNMLDLVPFRWNATRRGQAALCCFFALSVFVTTLFEAQAQAPRIDRRKEAIVALQPFSFDEP